MFHRLINPIKSNSFFVFGARGTGKSTYLKGFLEGTQHLYIDLLDPQIEQKYSLHPEILKDEISEMRGSSLEWVCLDEIQKIPKLLDVVHSLIESTKIKFVLTGSSARKLKRGTANLLAGRAFVNYLHPLTFPEMGESFDLQSALEWGTLPRVTQLSSQREKISFLDSYGLTYLKEEVWAEHVVRKLDPFRRFLEVAAQSNGEIINYTKISEDVGADVKTVQSYFEILVDTLIGFHLPACHRSVRKQQRQAPKFYLFDPGVKRALDQTLTVPIIPTSSSYGKAFEHWILLEMFRLNQYLQKFYRFSYLRTKEGAEIDVVIERPGLPTALVEIKSTEQVTNRDTGTIEKFLKDISPSEGYCLSRDPVPKRIGSVHALPWDMGFRELGFS